MSEIAHRAGSLGIHPTVACIEWIDPLMAGGNWMPELIEMAGGINLFGEAGKHSPWMTWEELESSDPDVIIVTPCGFDIDRSMEEMPGVSSLLTATSTSTVPARGYSNHSRSWPRSFIPTPLTPGTRIEGGFATVRRSPQERDD